MDSLYIKFDDYIKVNHPKVTIGDVAKIYSSNKSIASKIKTLKLHKLDSGEHSRIVFSSLKVVEIIEEEYPNLDITLIGADDFLISYDYKKPTPKWITCILVGFICLAVTQGFSLRLTAQRAGLGGGAGGVLPIVFQGDVLRHAAEGAGPGLTAGVHPVVFPDGAAALAAELTHRRLAAGGFGPLVLAGAAAENQGQQYGQCKTKKDTFHGGCAPFTGIRDSRKSNNRW